MSAYQRRKGARGELEAAKELQRLFPNARRRACGEESQGDRGRDLDGTHPLRVQCRISSKPMPERKLLEAEVNAKPGEIPVAMTRRDGDTTWMVTLRLPHFIEIMEQARIGRNLAAMPPVTDAPHD